MGLGLKIFVLTIGTSPAQIANKKLNSSREISHSVRSRVVVLEVDRLCSHVSYSHPYLTSTCPAGF